MKTDRVLDRRVPTDFSHVEAYPGSKLRMLQRTVKNVEVRMRINRRYIKIYDQGSEGACVGFGESILMSLLNRQVYDAQWLYREAQAVDEYPETPAEEGTSLRAGFDVLRTVGHRRLWNGAAKPPTLDAGIVDVNRWLTTVDEVRTAIAEGKPVVFGWNWYESFYEPTTKKHGRTKDHFIALNDAPWGALAGGHCICCVGASDERQSVLLQNSWGPSYPPIYVPYESVTRLLNEDGEAAIVVDR